MRFATFVGAGASVLGLLFACSSSDSNGAAPANDAGDESTPPPGDDGGDASADGGAPGPADPKSGTRIEARYHTTSDGAAIFRTLHDKQLDVDCFLHQYDDGSIRCIPLGNVGIGSYYEAGCTKSIGVVEKLTCADEKTFAVEEIPAPVGGANPCALKKRAYRVGAAVTHVFQKDGSPSGCSEVPLDPQFEAYSLGPALAASELVGFTITTDVLTPKLGARVYHGDDGSIGGSIEFSDPARGGKACSIDNAADGKPRCVPVSSFYGDEYGESGCGTHVVKDVACKANDYTYDDSVAIVSDPIAVADQCRPLGPTQHAYVKGAVRATKDYWEKGDTTCAGPLTSPTDLYDLGAELPAASFPELTIERRGGTRIQEEVHLESGTVVDRTDTPYDTQLGAYCNFGIAADGKLRCIPSGAPTGVFFSDDKCQNPVGEDSDACRPAKYVVVPGAPACNAQPHVHALGAALDPKTTPFYQSVGPGSCQQVMNLEGRRTMYAPGAEVDPTTFAEGTLQAR